MTDNKVKLLCILEGDSSIRDEPPNDLHDIEADKLILWSVSIPSTPKRIITLNNLTIKDRTKKFEELEDSTSEISKHFGTSPAKNTIHVIVQLPAHASAGGWHNALHEIKTKFFAPESYDSKSICRFVQEVKDVPTLDGSLKGLPIILPRIADYNKYKDKPTLLFFDLPGSSATTSENPTSVDEVLEEIYSRPLPYFPLFGASGCGKTRTAVEMLSKNWGFYFNGIETDIGSRDIIEAINFVDRRAMSRAQTHQPCLQRGSTRKPKTTYNGDLAVIGWIKATGQWASAYKALIHDPS
ncbi:hypothetical protein BGZ76_010782 [Entomortierella beljakovae]|nr:hypothetical protein BGZ76_010782 [Entomortierella beljakovae]